MTDDQPSSAGVTLVALLYLHPGRATELERFERAASRIMAKYGGRIERRIQPHREGGASPDARIAPPDEIHVVSFPDADSFARYRADGDLLALAELRASAIRETVIWQGADRPPFVQTVRSW